MVSSTLFPTVLVIEKLCHFPCVHFSLLITTTIIFLSTGFNPVWKESFEFEVKEPRLAFLQFVVKDQCIVSMVNPKLGEYLLPVFTLKRGKILGFKLSNTLIILFLSGYRHLRLQIDGEDTVSTLFVHVVRDKRHPHITPL